MTTKRSDNVQTFPESCLNDGRKALSKNKERTVLKIQWSSALGQRMVSTDDSHRARE